MSFATECVDVVTRLIIGRCQGSCLSGSGWGSHWQPVHLPPFHSQTDPEPGMRCPSSFYVHPVCTLPQAPEKVWEQ